jgi:exosome complex exonuclease RRP6
VPLGYHFRDVDMESGSDLQVYVSCRPIPLLADCLRNHPYLYEIKHIKYPPHLFEAAPPIAVDSFDQTPFHWISTVEQLDALLEKLRKATEIAIDLEHHDYRTFAGFLCLMQISTREEDFIIDVLVLRDELRALNEVFTNPNILKAIPFPQFRSGCSRVFRLCMAPRVTSFGFSKISTYISSIYSTRSMLQRF